MRAFLHFPPHPILNRFKNELADPRPVKTIKKEKDRFYCIFACSVEVTCAVTIIMLENIFGNIKMLLPTRKEGRETALLSLHLRRHRS